MAIPELLKTLGGQDVKTVEEWETFRRGEILDLYEKNLKDDGVFIFEIGYDQGESLKSLAEERSMECKIVCDLGGRDRVAVIRRGSLA